jgi:peptide subunit release factor 1 (eRF1)
MKFTSRNQIEAVAHAKTNDLWTSSFYLNSDKSRFTRKEIGVALKNLLNQGRSRLESLDLSKAKKDSLAQDLEKIGRFGSQALLTSNGAGLAVFSCAGASFWQDFTLPRPPRDHLVFDRSPYLRPLSVILDEFHPICALILDRHEARWYSILMGEINLVDQMTSDVPSRVREGGWQGYESKRIERHIDAHLHDHFKKAAQTTFELFKKNQFDWLLLGCKEEYRSNFEPLLHPYLKERLKGRLKVNSSESEDKILKQALEVEKSLKQEEEAALAQSFVSELEKGGRAVSGIRDVLRKLNIYEVQALVLNRNFSQEGRSCPKCHFLYVDELRCPNCDIKTDKALDIVHDAVHVAMDHKNQVRYVTPPSKLNRYGEIGAFLRYKT